MLCDASVARGTLLSSEMFGFLSTKVNHLSDWITLDAESSAQASFPPFDWVLGIFCTRFILKHTLSQESATDWSLKCFWLLATFYIVCVAWGKPLSSSITSFFFHIIFHVWSFVWQSVCCWLAVQMVTERNVFLSRLLCHFVYLCVAQWDLVKSYRGFPKFTTFLSNVQPHKTCWSYFEF